MATDVSRGARDLSSRRTTTAQRFDLMTDEDHADGARTRLAA